MVRRACTELKLRDVAPRAPVRWPRRSAYATDLLYNSFVVQRDQMPPESSCTGGLHRCNARLHHSPGGLQRYKTRVHRCTRGLQRCKTRAHHCNGGMHHSKVPLHRCIRGLQRCKAPVHWCNRRLQWCKTSAYHSTRGLHRCKMLAHRGTGRMQEDTARGDRCGLAADLGVGGRDLGRKPRFLFAGFGQTFGAFPPRSPPPEDHHSCACTSARRRPSSWAEGGRRVLARWRALRNRSASAFGVPGCSAARSGTRTS